jgi:hypothetical protein
MHALPTPLLLLLLDGGKQTCCSQRSKPRSAVLGTVISRLIIGQRGERRLAFFHWPGD